jgi:hypothetical protein
MVMLLMDGFDDCILGVCYRFGREPIVAYDYNKVIDKLQKDGMSYEEAVEFWEYNQIGAWVGEGTPCFVERMNLDALQERIEIMEEE